MLPSSYPTAKQFDLAPTQQAHVGFEGSLESSTAAAITLSDLHSQYNDFTITL
jgi:hypothetical protein